MGRLACFMLIWSCASQTILAEDIESHIRAILKVEKVGAGHAAAVTAVKFLSQRSTTALIPLLRGMDQANPLAENWLRGAFVSIADRNFKEGTPLPKEELERFALDRSHAPQSRKLAFDWLVRIDPSAPDRLIPGMLDDPSAEFRREAVERVIDAAEKASEQKDNAKCKDLYLQAFRAALDPDQLNLAFDELSAMGEIHDLKSQLGLLDSWWLIGPFDHRNGIGFEAGTEQEIAWIKKVSDQRHATLDLNKLIAPHHGAVAYAYREFESDRAQDVEIRYGTPNGSKLWVNGELLFAHDEYHQTMRMDQYRVLAKLQPGTNKILLKICQNEQTEDWAQRWEFQVRICDSSGTAVLPLNATHPKITSPIQE
jgi:hypothetical protein